MSDADLQRQNRFNWLFAPQPAPARRIPGFGALLRHWREDLRANGGRASGRGFQSVAIYRFGVWVDDLPWPVPRVPLRGAYVMLAALARNAYAIEIPASVRAGRRLHLGGRGGITIHPGTRLGDDCVIRNNVTIGGPGTGQDSVPVIGDRVTISPGALLLASAHLEDDVLIGPEAVVRSHVPAETCVIPHRAKARAGQVILLLDADGNELRQRRRWVGPAHGLSTLPMFWLAALM